MSGEQLFEIWAPVEPTQAGWSRWAKPVLFGSARIGPVESVPERLLPWPDVPWAPGAADGVAVVIDVPGERAVELGVALAERGFRPVPLFNGTDAPVDDRATVRTRALVDALAEGGVTLARTVIDPEAPPVFLLDSLRGSTATPRKPGVFDNRWVVLPQDMPSAAWLMANGIAAVRVVFDTDDDLATDLRHVLVRWQEAGLHIDGVHIDRGGPPTPMQVRRPRGFGVFWYAALAVLGLRQNSTGGFGGVVPQPSSAGRGGFG